MDTRNNLNLENNLNLTSAKEKQEYINAVATGFCPNCGEAVIQPKRGRTKKFCSERCRFQWKNRHPKPENWKSTRTAVCQFCGKEFIATREYTHTRKFCSRACANRSRAEERKRQKAEEQERQAEQTQNADQQKSNQQNT